MSAPGEAADPCLVDGRYEVSAEVGRGGQGVAFLARDRRSGGERVLVKVLRDASEESRALLEAESRAMARLAHPAVPAVREVGRIRSVVGSPPDAALRPGALFLVRGFIDGDDLFAATRGRPWPEVRALLVAAARALAAVHARGLVHGDLKPGNILVPRQGEGGWPVRLIDFGPGVTVEYLAPERIRGRAPDRRSDLFSLGVTAYRVISGALPFEGRTFGEVARAVLEGAPAALDGRAPSVPAEATGAVMRLIAPSPARRLRSAAAFLRALGETDVEETEQRLVISLAAAPLAGRAEEAQALAATACLLPGRPRTALVLGGRGAGKSRLLEEAALAARLAGVRVARAGGRRSEGAGFALFAEALPDVLVGASGPFAPTPEAPRADASERLRALDALAGRIIASAAGAPLAVLLDDLDLAGEDDRALAALLARRLAGADHGMALVASARDGRRAEVPGLLVQVGDLAEEALPELVKGVLGPLARGERELLLELRRRAGLSPALIEAAMQDLARSGELRAGPAGTVYEPSGASAVGPGEGATAPLAPAEATPAPGRALLVALETLGRPAPIGLLAAAIGVPPEDAMVLARRLVEEGLALETAGRVALSPGRAALAPEPGERAAAALSLAQALAALPAAERDPAEEGRLLRSAGRPEEAAPRLLLAARGARAAGAILSARRLFEEAAEASALAELRAQALEGAGEAALIAGAPEEAARHLERSLDAHAASSPAGASDGRLAAVLLLAAEADTARGALGRALERIAAARADRPGVTARADLLAGVVHLLRGELDAAEAAFSTAIRDARGPLLRSAALGELAGVHFRRAEPARAAALLTEAARLARESGDPRARALCHGRLGHALEALGDRDAARRHHLRSIRLYERAGDRAGLSGAWGNLGNLLRNEGALARAERLYARSVRVKRELGILASRATSLMALSQVRLAMGRPEAALRDADRARREAAKAGEEQSLLQALLARAEALAALGRLDEARRTARAIRRREKARPQVYGRARSRWAIAHILLASGKPLEAARHLRRAERDLAKAGHPVDLLRAHALLVEAYRRAAGLPPGNAAAAGISGQVAGASPPAGAPAGGEEGGRASETMLAREGSALAAERGRSARLIAAAAALAEEAEPARLLDRVCDDAVHLLGAERAFVVLRREDGGLDFAATRNFEGAAVLLPESKAPRALLETVLAEGRAVVSADALRDRRLRELTSVQLLDVRSVVAVPIREPGGATVGALYADHRLRPGGFGEDAARLLAALAAMAAAAVSRERLRAALRSREAEAATLRARLDARGADDTAPVPAPGASGAPGDPFGAIVGASPAIRDVKALAARVAVSELPVLILGESGTGKELLARAIHEASRRAGRPFVAESCAALPESLLEGELFGHVKGAFTGADRDRDGLFALASGGTLFLDEVGDTSAGMQAKLLRALEEGLVRPVGGAEARRVDVRVLAATNRDIDAMRQAGTFRDDLFFRLGGVTIRLPPLRERAEDLLLIAERSLEEIARRGARRRLLLEPEAAAMLRRHRWPGNVRELCHVLRAASLFAERSRIGPAALLAAGLRVEETGAVVGAVAAPAETPAGTPPPTYAALREGLDAREAAFIRGALERAGGNRGRAAASVGLSRFALLRILRRLGIE